MAYLDPAIVGDFDETATVRQLTGRDSFGKPTYDKGLPYRCRWIRRETMMFRADGQTVRADGELWLAPRSGTLPDVHPDDNIILPNGSTRRILSIEIYEDGIGMDHVKVLYGRLGQR